VPVDELCEDTACEEADRAAARSNERVDAERLRSLARLGEHRHDDPEDDRGGHGPSGSLDESRGDQELLALREAAKRGGRGEDRQADHEHPLPTDQVAKTPGEEQQAAERDQVRVDDPGQVRLREVQVVLDGRQRDVHDRLIQDDHQESRAENDQRDPTIAVAPFLRLRLWSHRLSRLAAVARAPQ